MIKQYPGLQPVEKSLTATASSLEGFFPRECGTSATRATNDGSQLLYSFISARYHLKLPKVDNLSRSSNASRTSRWKRTTNCSSGPVLPLQWTRDGEQCHDNSDVRPTFPPEEHVGAARLHSPEPSDWACGTSMFKTRPARLRHSSSST